MVTIIASLLCCTAWWCPMGHRGEADKKCEDTWCYSKSLKPDLDKLSKHSNLPLFEQHIREQTNTMPPNTSLHTVLKNLLILCNNATPSSDIAKMTAALNMIYEREIDSSGPSTHH